MNLQLLVCPDCKGQLFHDGSIVATEFPCPTCRKPLVVEVPAGGAYHSDPPRCFEDKELGLTCDLAGQIPVQGEGEIQGYPLYFRAKWDCWTFRVALNGDINIATIIDPQDEQHGFFTDGEWQGYYLDGDYGEASYMRYDTAEALIRYCAKKFVHDLSQRRKSGV